MFFVQLHLLSFSFIVIMKNVKEPNYSVLAQKLTWHYSIVFTGSQIKAWTWAQTQGARPFRHPCVKLQLRRGKSLERVSLALFEEYMSYETENVRFLLNFSMKYWVFNRKTGVFIITIFPGFHFLFLVATIDSYTLAMKLKNVCFPLTIVYLHQQLSM